MDRNAGGCGEAATEALPNKDSTNARTGDRRLLADGTGRAPQRRNGNGNDHLAIAALPTLL